MTHTPTAPRLAVAGLIAVTLAVTTLFTAPSMAATATRRTVIAVMGEPGLNVLHEDFALGAEEELGLPSAAPAAAHVALPASGTFVERLSQARSGPLGALPANTLHYIEGTRVLVYAPTDESRANEEPYDLLADRLHGTGVASAAAGAAYGTSPSSIVVFVPGTARSGWEWVADQKWIDLVTVSSYELVRGGDLLNATPSDRTCPEAAAVRDLTASGRVVFASAGNSDFASLHSSPNGLADVYQVGGVDADGRSVFLPQQDDDPFFAAPVTTRPYETGDSYSFDAASADALEGPMRFGGTSGATPRTTGRAAELIAHARERLSSTFAGARSGALARTRTAARAPAKGPLSDGDLTGGELADLLHQVAVPYEPDAPGRYFIEGYGALTDAAIARAKDVLDGSETLAARPLDDAAHSAADNARAAYFDTVRCQ